MIDKLNKLISVLEGGEGIDRFERRVEREAFKQWLSKFKESFQFTISEGSEVIGGAFLGSTKEFFGLEDQEEDVEGTHDDPQVGTT